MLRHLYCAITSKLRLFGGVNAEHGGGDEQRVERRFERTSSGGIRAWRGFVENHCGSFGIDKNTLHGWVKRKRATGSVSPKPHAGGTAHKKIREEHEQALARWLSEEPGLTQLQMAKRIEEEFGVSVSQATICNTLKRMNWSFKTNAS